MAGRVLDAEQTKEPVHDQHVRENQDIQQRSLNERSQQKGQKSVDGHPRSAHRATNAAKLASRQCPGQSEGYNSAVKVNENSNGEQDRDRHPSRVSVHEHGY